MTDARFVQVASADDCTLAVDSNGAIWRLHHSAGIWSKLPPHPDTVGMSPAETRAAAMQARQYAAGVQACIEAVRKVSVLLATSHPGSAPMTAETAVAKCMYELQAVDAAASD